MRLPDPATIAAALDAGSRSSTPRGRTAATRRWLGSQRLPRSRCARRHEGRDGRRGWVPDGRARAIRADCEASLEALDGLADRPLPAARAGSARRRGDVGARAGAAARRGPRAARRARERQPDASSTRRSQHAPVAAVQVALGPARRHARFAAALVERCEELGIAVIAHSPLGGPEARLPQRAAVRVTAAAGGGRARLDARAVAGVVAIPGARPARDRALGGAGRTARARCRTERERLTRARSATGRPARARAAATTRERRARRRHPGRREEPARRGVRRPRGYARLNRDERGGSLRELAGALEELLAAGERRVVLDNTYLTRAARSYAIEAAAPARTAGCAASGSTRRSRRRR